MDLLPVPGAYSVLRPGSPLPRQKEGKPESWSVCFVLISELLDGVGRVAFALVFGGGGRAGGVGGGEWGHVPSLTLQALAYTFMEPLSRHTLHARTHTHTHTHVHVHIPHPPLLLRAVEEEKKEEKGCAVRVS